MGDWVAHPSNTAARRILVTYSFRAALPGEGSPEPPGIRMNNFILCPMISVFKMNNPSSYVQWSLFCLCFLLPLAELSCKPKGQVKLESFVVSSQVRNQFSKPSTKNGACSMTTCSKIDDLRARSMCVCVCVILHISSWRYGGIVTFFWCINDDCNLCVWFCISRLKIWPHCNLVLIYQWWL
jgi:hypothetical protein